MNILLLFATSMGSTDKATQYLMDVLEDHHLPGYRKPIAEAILDEIEACDMLIIASPNGRYDQKTGQAHPHFMNFFDLHPDLNLKGKPVAILGMGNRTYEHFCGSVPIVEHYLKLTKGKFLVKPLLIDRYKENEGKRKKEIKVWAEKLAHQIHHMKVM